MQAQGRTAVTPRAGATTRLVWAGIAGAVLLLDQITKLAVVRSVSEGDGIEVTGWLEIAHVRNSGAAFGLLRGWAGMFALAAVAGVLVFAVMLWRQPPTGTGVAAALVAGGVLGNLTDRIFRGPIGRGSVVDFVDVGFWPAFNVADSAIVIGALLLVWFGFREPHTDRHREAERSPGTDGEEDRRD